MKELILVLAVFSSFIAHAQDRASMAKFFEDNYLDYDNKEKSIEAEFNYNKDLNTVHLGKDIFFKNDDRRVVSKITFSIENISSIEETIGKSKFDGRTLYTYTLKINFLKTVFGNVRVNEVDRIDDLEYTYLAPSQFYVAEEDIAILTKFTKVFFEGVKIVNKVHQ